MGKRIPFEEQEASSSLIIELRLTLHPKSTADLPSSKYWPKKSQFHGSVHRPLDKMAFTGNCSRIVHLSVALSPSPVAEGESQNDNGRGGLRQRLGRDHWQMDGNGRSNAFIIGIIHLPGRYSHRPIVRTGSTPVLIFPRVDKSSNGDGACEGSRVRNRSTRKVCSRREDRLCVYLLPAQQLPVEVTHPVRLVSLSFIVLRPPATPFVFVLCLSLSFSLSLSLSLTCFLSSFLPLFLSSSLRTSTLVSPWLRWSIYSHAAATHGAYTHTQHEYTRDSVLVVASSFFVVVERRPS